MMHVELLLWLTHFTFLCFDPIHAEFLESLESIGAEETLGAIVALRALNVFVPSSE